MRISLALKSLIIPLLALLLLAGCVAPASTPVSVPTNETGSVTISVTMPRTGYQTQHLISDIQSMVFGLVDISNDPYFGYADGSDLPESAAGNRYHAAIAGDANPSSGLLSGNGLNEGQWAQTQRYLYVATNNNSSRSMTFGNIRPSATARYVAFVAAFNKDATTTTVAKADAIGFAQSAAFAVASDGSTTVPPLTMVLDRGLGSFKLTLDIDQTTNGVLLSDMDKLVVAFVDVSAPATRTPHLGYEILDGVNRKLNGTDTDPTYHKAVAGYWDGGQFNQDAFNYVGTPLSLEADRGNSARFLYHVETTTLTNTATRQIVFDNLKAGGDYRVIALALDGGELTPVASGSTQSTNVTITQGQQASTYLKLILTN
jgi:hypothetical protein